MAKSNDGGLGQHLTSIIVALIGALSAIGGAWIMTNGPSSAQSAPAAQVSTMAAQPDAAAQPVSASIAPAAPSQPPIVIVGAPAEEADPAPLSGSTTIDYGQPWPNQQGATQLIVERIEASRERVRVYLRFDNIGDGPVTFYTATSTSSTAQGIQTAISDKKGPAHGVTATGGALFADPRAVVIPAGVQLRGWLEYAIGKGKKDGLSLSFTSQTEGYPSAGAHRIQYDALPIPAAK